MTSRVIDHAWSCLLTAVTILFLCLLFESPALAEDQTEDYGNITVIYRDHNQLNKFAEMIQPSALDQGLSSIFGGGGGSSASSDLGRYLNGLLQRVQRVLDMPIPRIKIIIKIFDSQRGLSQAAATLMGRGLSEPGFYWHATKTIHVTLDDLSVGILAHEMGHSVIDHFLVVKPPPKIAEMLCQYVDKEISEGRY